MAYPLIRPVEISFDCTFFGGDETAMGDGNDGSVILGMKMGTSLRSSDMWFRHSQVLGYLITQAGLPTLMLREVCLKNIGS